MLSLRLAPVTGIRQKLLHLSPRNIFHSNPSNLSSFSPNPFQRNFNRTSKASTARPPHAFHLSSLPEDSLFSGTILPSFSFPFLLFRFWELTIEALKNIGNFTNALLIYISLVIKWLYYNSFSFSFSRKSLRYNRIQYPLKLILFSKYDYWFTMDAVIRNGWCFDELYIGQQEGHRNCSLVCFIIPH